jgi:hypothetical protein
MIKLITILAALALSIASATAQFPPGPIGEPFVLPVTVGTSSALAVPASPTHRKKLVFVNSSSTAKIAVCPTISRVTGAAFTCTVNGAGSITLLPLSQYTIAGPGPQTIIVGTAWNAIADNAGSPLTVLEFE